VAEAVERDAIRPGSLPEIGGTENFALGYIAELVDAQAGDTTPGGFDDIEPLFPGIETDLVRETKAIGDNAKHALVIERHVPVFQVRAQGMHPVLDARRNGDPQAVLGIAEYKVHLPDFATVQAVG